MPITTLDDFSKEASEFSKRELSDLLPNGITKEIGHFNVFDVAEAFKVIKEKPHMTYNRRAYYKINSLTCTSR